MKVTGKTKRLKDEVLMSIKMEHSTLEIGKKIDNMVTESNNGQMGHITKATTNMAKNTELATSAGLMGLVTLGSFTITISMGRVFTLGKMVGNMKVNGEQTECMAKVHSHGLMEGSLLVNMLMTKRKDMESLFGLMEGVIGENGLMESNMVKEHMLLQVARRSMGSGEMAKGLDG